MPNELQSTIAQWQREHFPTGTGLIHQAVGLSEEVGELCRAILKQDQKVRGSWEDWQDEIRKEVGDVGIRLMLLADAAGFDVQTCVEQRATYVMGRDINHDPAGTSNG